MLMGEEGNGKDMPSNNDDLFWKWKTIYDELLDPFTGTVADKYFSPILETQFSYCKKIGIPISIAILDITNLPNPPSSTITLESYLLIRNIIHKIRKISSKNDMVFYNGGQIFSFIFPKSNKENTQRLVNNIEEEIGQLFLKDIPLSVKCGYAEFPQDADDPVGLQKCAKNALAIANQSNKVIGYFNERRKTTRIPLQIEVRYIVKGSPERLTCSRNISETGIMLSGMPDLKLGEDTKLIFNLPEINKSPITISARAIWNKTNAATGKMDIGLCFTSFDINTMWQLKRFITNAPPPIVNL